MSRGTSRQSLDALFVATCFIVLFGVFPFFPRVNNPNEVVRFYMTAAVVERGTYQIDEMRARWGHVNDAANYEGRAYSVKAPGTSFLGLPAYAAYFHACKALGVEWNRTVALWLMRATASIGPFFIFIVVFRRWLLRRVRHPLSADLVSFALCLGSPLLAYGLLFVSHTTAAISAFSAFMLLASDAPSARTGTKYPFFAGLFAAGATAFEYPAAVVSALLSAYALTRLRSWRARFSYAAGALVPTLAVMHFQWCAFGSPFRPGHVFVEDPHFREAHHKGVYGFEGWHSEALAGLLGDPGYGLFTLTPILAFAVVGFVLLAKNRTIRPSGLSALGIVLITIVSLSMMTVWRGGWTVGPRLMMTVYPFLAWGAAIGVDALLGRARRLGTTIALGAVVSGVVLAGVPSLYFPHYPEDVARPFSQIVVRLIGADFAPLNAANLVGIWGTASMVGFGALFVGALVVFVATRSRDVSGSAVSIAGGALVAAIFVLVCSKDPDETTLRSLGFITDYWHPQGHDEISRGLLELRAPSHSPERCAELERSFTYVGRLGDFERVGGKCGHR